MNIQDFALRIEAAKNDSSELARIAEKLASVPGTDARNLRFRALAMRVALRKANVATERPMTPTWLSELGIQTVDGRALHRYNISDQSFAMLEEGLKAKAAQFRIHVDGVPAAQFVLWAAEWFRRRYDGSGLKWEALGASLGINPDWSTYRLLTDRGLKYWQILPLRINGTHHRIAAIARQGGFPIAAVEGKGTRWAPQFLERLVGLLLAEPTLTLDVADRIAESLMPEFVPLTWRNPEIRVVSAELAMEIVKLRTLAESHGVPSGALVSVWLDRNMPDWRDDLPIGVSSEAGRALVDGLMKAVVLTGSAGSVEVKRLLTLGEDGRREQVELKLTGGLRDASGRAIAPGLGDEWTRLRLYASGQFARHVSGELATADPSDENVWLARPSTGRSLFDLPASVEVMTELRGGGQRIGHPFVLPGGEAVISNVRIYVAEGQEKDSAPTQFLLIGTGSGGYRPSCVHVELPSDWSCTAREAESHVEGFDGSKTEARGLWDVRGSALIKSPQGDTYLVRTGQKGDTRDTLFMIGHAAHGLHVAGSPVPLYRGAPRLRLREGFRERAPATNEVYWRARDTTTWLAQPDEATGLVQFAWRDSHTGHIRDRRDALVLPVDFSIERHRIGEWLDLAIIGWTGAIEVDGATRVGDSYRLRASGGSHRFCEVRLLCREAQPICLAVPLSSDAWIETWSEGPVAANGVISLSGINRYVARVDGRCELMAELLDRDRQPVAEGFASWWVNDELPLSAISDDLATLLRPQGDIRASVKLNFNDSRENYWYVGEFDHQLVREGRGWLPDRAVDEPDARIVGRALHEPAKEHDFGTVDLLSCLNHRPVELPLLRGCWLVYLRSNERVLSCPQFINGLELMIAPNAALGKAMAIRDDDGRSSALNLLLDGFLADPTTLESRTLLRNIIELAVSLDGLPPATFDILALIAHRPLVAALLLFSAADSELEPVLRIADGLPFDWPLVPKDDWGQAAQSQFEYLVAQLPDEAIDGIARLIGDRRKALADLIPALASVLGQKIEQESLAISANAFLNRSGDRIQEFHSPFRPQFSAELPTWQVLPEFWRALDAPAAAALAAVGRIELNHAQIRCIKQIHRRHPRWFREGFIAALEEY